MGVGVVGPIYPYRLALRHPAAFPKIPLHDFEFPPHEPTERSAAMTRTCGGCATGISHLQATAKACSSKCRKRMAIRAARRESPEPEASPLVDRTIQTLTNTGLLDTYEGQLAVILAKRITRSSLDSGASMASLSKELRQIMADLKTSEIQVKDPIDQLRARRERRESGGNKIS